MSQDSDRDVALATAVELLSENHQRIIEVQRSLDRQGRVRDGLLFLGIAILFVVIDGGAVYADMPWLAWAFGVIAAIVLLGALVETIRDYRATVGDREA